jgi:hypothetical protein
MTITQWQVVQDVLIEKFKDVGENEWHDGDCIGADTQAHGAVRSIKEEYGFDVTLHGHPCNLPGDVRAHNEYDVMHSIAPPLVRNRVIVNSVNLMIAAPKQFDEVIRGSGTWATIRYARLKKIPLIIIYPDGTREDEGA